MDWAPASVVRWLFASEQGASDRLISRWIFLRALGLIYFSAFLSLVFQIRGLIGPQGILPANNYLQAVGRSLGHLTRLWFAPTLLWLSSSSHMLLGLCWMGMFASLLLVLNIWPRAMLVICFACFLSFVSAAQDFSGYQSDGMLLEAGFVSLFFAPPGIFPGWGAVRPPIRASLFLLQWEWFRIYFESGIAKIASGDPQWRNLRVALTPRTVLGRSGIPERLGGHWHPVYGYKEMTGPDARARFTTIIEYVQEHPPWSIFAGH